MKRTGICELLGIEYPIIQAPMAGITWAELAVAVSNAGGMGTIGPNAGSTTPTSDVTETGERLRGQIRKAKSLTSKPFAVNFPIGGVDLGFSERCIQVAIEERIPVAITSMGSPRIYTDRLHEAGAKVLHVVASVRHAKGSEAAGVDAVVAAGYDGGGHLGLDELPTFVLVPQVVDAVKIPVVASGGIADARGLIAALALGADGVYMGTRFLATHESVAHTNMKKAVIEATDAGTVTWGRGLDLVRTVKSDFSRRYLEKEAGGASVEGLQIFLRGQGGQMPATVTGDIDNNYAFCGAVAGMINEIVSAEEVVRSIMDGVEAVLFGLQ
jgi:NAD(P)H-dependent flavin oxidoreductase YrpB (nitropropane dioxygenase family)